MEQLYSRNQMETPPKVNSELRDSLPRSGVLSQDGPTFAKEEDSGGAEEFNGVSDWCEKMRLDSAGA